MKLQQFITQYENALATQSWEKVSPLVHENVCVTFSNGILHNGKDAVHKAFEHNFSVIKSEKYSMTNINWVKVEEQFAVYTFDYFWKGLIDGVLVEGNGIGTSTLFNENDQWVLLTEHLGRIQHPT